MAGWSCLPNEMKFEIIKKMDFITRYRFRHVAMSTLILVDAIPFYIPRINIYMISDDDIHMLIYESATQARQFRFFISENYDQFFHTMTYNPRSTAPVEEISRAQAAGTLKKRRSKYKVIPRPIYAFTCALKTITSASPRTILGGIGVFGELSTAGEAEMMPLLEGCRIRARILAHRNDWRSFVILMRCSRSDAVEVHQVMSKKGTSFGGAETRETVRRIEARVSWMRFQSSEPDNNYIVCNRYGDGDMKALCEGLYQEIGPNHYLHDKREEKIELFDTPCGFMNRKLPLGFFEEKPQECPRRRACRKHSDPFEYWYFNEERSFYNGKAVRTIHANEMYEDILPVVNGVCPVKEFMDGFDEKLVDWKKVVWVMNNSWRYRVKISGNQGRKGKLQDVLEWIAEVWKLVSYLTLAIVLVYILGRCVEKCYWWILSLF